MPMSMRTFAAAKDPSNLSAISRDDVISSGDTQWIGSYLKAVAAAGDASHGEYADEYFRKNFRKLTSE